MIGRGVLTAIVALLAMGCLALLVEAQSSSSVYWTGDRVAGSSQGGIIFYTYHGRNYTITDSRRGAGDVASVPVAVYVDPGDPTQAMADGPTRWVEGIAVGGWFVAAAALVPVGYVRQRRRRRRQEAFAAGQA